MVLSPKRTSNWVDSSCWIARTSTKRFAGRRRFRMQSMAQWRFAHCGQRYDDFENRMTTGSQIEKTFREEHGRVLAALISQLGDFELAEDALQDALVNALERWQMDGVPRNPGAWLVTVAKRRAIDRLRHSKFEEHNPTILESLKQEEPEMDDSLPDDRLKLMFTCCHPALALEAQVALTLHT